MDTYSIAMEAYSDRSGSAGIGALVKQAVALSHIWRICVAPPGYVRGDEFAYEDLLASDYWEHIEALRVAAAYARVGALGHGGTPYFGG